MPDRQSHASTPRLTSVLALLALALIAPLGTSCKSAAPTRSDCLRPVSSDLPGRPTALFNAEMASDAVPHEYALLSENSEQEEAGAPDGHRVSTASRSSSRTASHRRLVVQRSMPAVYPLRC